MMMMIKKSFDIVFRKCLVGKRDKRRFSENIRRNNRKAMVFIQKTVKQHTSHRNIVKGKRVECFLVNCSNENIAKGTRAQAVTS